MYNSLLLQKIYANYNIHNLKFGNIGDKLGDCFEDFVVDILMNDIFLHTFNSNQCLPEFEYEIFKLILHNFGLSPHNNISHITATSNIKHRITGGMPKTDVIADVAFSDGSTYSLPISVKQTTAQKVAFAEFDVNTIAREVGITDSRLIELMLKHQVVASAKTFNPDEKIELTERLAPYAARFVEWVVTGSPVACNDLRIPKCIVKFDIDKNALSIFDYAVYTVDQYVHHIMFDKKGNIRRGGFGTGLSWTYATGSKGEKIQFKG